jgi:SH3 domain-containing protein
MIDITFLLLVMLVLPAGVEATQVGRVTNEVNFRKGPDRSAPVIARLPADTEVEVIRLDSSGWYFITYRGRPGFVHKNYITLGQHQNSDQRLELWRRQLAVSAGIILAGIGIILMARILAPDILKTAAVLVIALVLVLVLDLLFQLGVLYSLYFVSFGVFALFLLLKSRKKSGAIAVNQITPRKAA